MDRFASRSLIVLSLACVVGIALVWDFSVVHADEKEDARVLLEDGDEYLDKGDRRKAKGRTKRAMQYYEKALKAYQQAYQLVPKVTIYYAIANAEARLERYEVAIAHYQRVIAEVEKPQLQDMARQRIVELTPYVAIVVFNIMPEGAELSINAELRGVSPFERPLMLMPGEHTCTITAEGHTPQEVVLTLEAGSKLEKDIELEKISVVVKRPQVRDEDESLHVPGTRLLKDPGKGRLIFGAVATGTLLIAAGVTGGIGFSMDEGDDTADTLKIASLVTGILGIGTGVYTAYHYFGVYRPRKKALEKQAFRQTVPKLWAAPYVYGDGGGVAVLGRF